MLRILKPEMSGCLRDVLVASPGAIHDDNCIGRKRWSDLNYMSDGVRRFECGNDPLSLRQRLECAECFVVGRVNVFDALLVAQITVLGPDRGVIEPGGNGMRQLDLAVFIREHKSFCSLKNAETAALKAGRVFSGPDSFAAGFDAGHADGFIVEKGMENSDG